MGATAWSTWPSSSLTVPPGYTSSPTSAAAGSTRTAVAGRAPRIGARARARRTERRVRRVDAIVEREGGGVGAQRRVGPALCQQQLVVGAPAARDGDRLRRRVLQQHQIARRLAARERGAGGSGRANRASAGTRHSSSPATTACCRTSASASSGACAARAASAAARSASACSSSSSSSDHACGARSLLASSASAAPGSPCSRFANVFCAAAGRRRGWRRARTPVSSTRNSSAPAGIAQFAVTVSVEIERPGPRTACGASWRPTREEEKPSRRARQLAPEVASIGVP